MSIWGTFPTHTITFPYPLKHIRRLSGQFCRVSERMKVKNHEVIDEFCTFVNPEKPIPQRVVEVTNITDDMVRDAETIEQVLPKFLEFIGDSVLVAHNANFDIGFIRVIYHYIPLHKMFMLNLFWSFVQ